MKRLADTLICPFCHYRCDAATPVEGDFDEPKDGDLSICIKCGEWVVFADDVTSVRKPTDDEYLEIGSDRFYGTIRVAWEQTKYELETKGTTPFASEWEDYRRKVIPNLGKAGTIAVRDAYYAGALTLLGCLREVTNKKSSTEDRWGGFEMLRTEISMYLMERVNARDRSRT